MLVITDQRHSRALLLTELDPDRPMQSLIPNAAVGPVSKPLGVCIHANRYVLVADSVNCRIVVYDTTSNTWSAFGDASVFQAPRAICSDASGGLLIVDTVRLVQVADPTGGSLTEMLPVSAGRIPLAVACAAGTMEVAIDEGALLRSTDDGKTWNRIELAGPVPTMPSAIARGAIGPTYVCDIANGRLLAVDSSGEVSTILDATDGVVLPTSVSTSSDGRDVWIVDAVANRIRRFAVHPDGVEPAEYVNGRQADGSFRFDQVGGIALGEFA